MAQTLKFGKGTWATKTGSSMAYNDQNGNYKPLPFNVERDSIATRVNKEGLIEVVGKDKLRIDYTDSAKGVALLEPSRTNLVTYSEDFSNAAWSKSNSSITSNSVISPDGTQNADKLIPNATSSVNKYIYTIPTTSNGIDYTLTVFAKEGEYDMLRLEDGNNSQGAWFDLSNGTLGTVGASVTAKIQNYGNGWYRCSVTKPSVSTSVFFVISASNTESIQVGDGTSGVYIYGAMLEQGSYPTSIIKTQGSAVTRLADVCNNSGNDQVINSTEGVLFVEIAALSNDGTYRILSLSDGTTNERVYIQYTNASNTVAAVVKNGGVTQANMVYVLDDATNFSKAAIKYKANDFALWVNGVERNTDTSGSVPTGLNTLAFDDGGGNNDFYGKVKDIRVYNTALTDQELAALTQV